jgi:hypothetical protein
VSAVIPASWKALRGSTFRVKEELLALGARWDRDTGLWWISPERHREAQALIDETGGRRP